MDGTTAQTNTETVAPETTETVTETVVKSEGSAEATTSETSTLKDADAQETVLSSETEGAPEEYAEFTLPDGYKPDQALMDRFTTLAKEWNLPQERAQELVNLAAENYQSLLTSQREGWASVRKEWVDDLKNDPDFGGEKFDETVVRAKRALKNYGSDALIGFLDESGFGDNADVIRLLAKVDKATGEDTAVVGQPAKAEPKTTAEVLYGKTAT